jgi:regulator of ribonuclease activity A
MRATTDLYDDFEDTVQTCSLQFRDFGAVTRFCGPIRTVRCSNDNHLFRTLLGEPGNGCVLVVDGGGSLTNALMGDILAARGVANGWAGCVINGVVRDSAELATIGIGIKALGTNPAKSSKGGDGKVDIDVEFGGVCFSPGEWAYCDEDGILVSAGEIE